MTHSPVSSSAASTPVVLLDLDGTLLDSLSTVQDTLCLAAAELGKDRPSEDFLRGVAGPPMQLTMSRLGWSPAEVEQGMKIYITHYDAYMWHRAPLFAGIADSIAELAGDGYRLFLATSKREAVAQKTLQHVGLAAYFTEMVGAGNDARTRQTKSEVIAEALRLAGDAPEAPQGRYLMVGDRIHDVEGAAKFGIDTLLCEWGTGNAEEWARAAHTVKTVAELPSAVRSLLPWHAVTP